MDINMEIKYKLQGDGRDSWEITDGGNKYMTYERPYQWATMRVGLMTSTAFMRVLANPTLVNNVAYGALQTILATESKEEYLLNMLRATMTYTNAEKTEINKILSDNYFTIQL